MRVSLKDAYNLSKLRPHGNTKYKHFHYVDAIKYGCPVFRDEHTQVKYMLLMDSFTEAGSFGGVTKIISTELVPVVKKTIQKTETMWVPVSS